MKRTLLLAVSGILFLCHLSTAHAYIEDFADGNAGWRVYRLDSHGYCWGERAGFSAGGGRPGGYVWASIAGDTHNRFYGFDASARAFGDLDGQTITFDYRIDGAVTGAAGGPVSLRLYIGTDANSYYVSSDAASWDANSGSGWVTQTMAMNAVNFVPWPGQTGGQSFEEVAANAVWIGLVLTGTTLSGDSAILGVISAGGATIQMDNFGVVEVAAVPIGGTLWLLGSGVACFAGLKRMRCSNPHCNRFFTRN